jgi:hypothetical protein
MAKSEDIQNINSCAKCKLFIFEYAIFWEISVG